jgi:hypothetical protein
MTRVPLSHLMIAGRPAKTIVARRRKGDFTWVDLEGHVAGLCAQLAAHPKGRWLLSCESSYAFCVGLLALWHTQRIAVLPPNTQPDSLRESAHAAAGVITDGVVIPGKIALSPLASTLTGSTWKALIPARAILELFTSGSTGERKTVRKTLAQLDQEVAVLEKTFGHRLGACTVYATVSHHHIYGLLFRLLWPLSVGRPFADATFLLWDEWLAQLPSRAAAVLIASPAHLERIVPENEKVLRKKSIRVIFSSGGPLQESAAERFQTHAGHAPIEVFGSTETGGIGWRERRGADALWEPLNGVKVSIDNPKNSRLRVQTSFGASKAWILMGDRGRLFPRGRFSVEGRADRIVKIEEKRLSLDDMERRLQQHPQVKSARILLLESKPDTRSSLGAVLILTPQGRRQVARAGRAVFLTTLRAHLRKSFEASTLPRVFRIVQDFPVDGMGKVSRAVLVPLFRSSFDPLVTTPQRLKKSETPRGLTLRVRVPETLAYLEGHFPNQPIVPGVVQIQWVAEAAMAWLRKRFVVRRMDAIKFKTPLLPGHEFSIVIEHALSEGEALLRFSLMDGETLFSSGRLVLE